MKKMIVVALLLCSSAAQAAAVPQWGEARKVVEKCYSGWDVKINLTAGAKGSYDAHEYTELSTSRDISDSSYGSLSTISSEEGSVVQDSMTTDFDESSSNYDGVFDKDRIGSSFFVGLNMTVPLYDRSTRISKREKKNSAVSKLADLYAKYEGYRATVASIEAGQGVAKQIMMDGGEQAIRAYFGMLAEKEKARALMVSSRRKIFVTLEACGYVAGNRASRER
jgi:hypothetical protein